MRRTAIALPALLLSGCASQMLEHRDPRISDMELTAQTMPESVVQVPMPRVEPPGIPQRAEAASLWSRGNEGYFGDMRADAVGDILTIVIEIDDEAQLRNASNRQRQGGGSVGFPTLLGYETRLDELLPGIDEDSFPQGNILDLSSVTQAGGSGSIQRGESISLRVAALVIQELPNGNLVVAGRQEVMVNEELRELRVAGIIRPQDIRMDNTIPYDEIAEARITYGGRGSLSSTQERRYGEEALDIILPY